MSFNGSGVFVINSTGQPVVASTSISSSVFNAFTADIATGLTNVICRDGQSTITANIPFNGFKITGLGNGSSAQDAATIANTLAPASPVVFSVGSAATPPITFNGDTDSGIYWVSANSIAVTLGGSARATFSTTALTLTTNLSAVQGTFSGAVSGTTGTFTGNVSGVAGTFSGNVSGVQGIFSGAVSGTTGTFTGNVSGVAGTFSGAVSGTTGTFSGAISEQGTSLASKYILANRRFKSAQQAITGNNSTNTFAHGLGAVPVTFRAFLKCITADAGVGASVGEVREIIGYNGSGNTQGVRADATNVYVGFGSGGNTMLNWSSAALGNATFTYANWEVYVVASLDP